MKTLLIFFMIELSLFAQSGDTIIQEHVVKSLNTSIIDSIFIKVIDDYAKEIERAKCFGIILGKHDLDSSVFIIEPMLFKSEILKYNPFGYFIRHGKLYLIYGALSKFITSEPIKGMDLDTLSINDLTEDNKIDHSKYNFILDLPAWEVTINKKVSIRHVKKSPFLEDVPVKKTIRYLKPVKP